MKKVRRLKWRETKKNSVIENETSSKSSDMAKKNDNNRF